MTDAHHGKVRVFDRIFRRPGANEPADPRFGLRTSNAIGQDSGDVFATLTPGYNFDGTQFPVVRRKGDDPAAPPAAVILSVPNQGRAIDLCNRGRGRDRDEERRGDDD